MIEMSKKNFFSSTFMCICHSFTLQRYALVFFFSENAFSLSNEKTLLKKDFEWTTPNQPHRTVSVNFSIFICRSIQTKDTSYTVRGHSSTWASPWSTSSRSVSGYQRFWQTTSRKRTRTTVKLWSSEQPRPDTTAQYATDFSFHPSKSAPPAVKSDFSSNEVQHLHVQKGPLPTSLLLISCWLLTLPVR